MNTFYLKHISLAIIHTTVLKLIQLHTTYNNNNLVDLALMLSEVPPGYSECACLLYYDSFCGDGLAMQDKFVD